MSILPARGVSAKCHSLDPSGLYDRRGGCSWLLMESRFQCVKDECVLQEAYYYYLGR